MNPIETLIAGGILNRIRDVLQPAETYFCGDKDIKVSKGDVPPELLIEMQAFKDAAPADTRVTAWFVRTSDGERLNGEILMDSGEDTPSLVWKATGEGPQLVFEKPMGINFSSNTEKMLKLAEPLELLKALDRAHGEKIAGMVSELGYEPRFSADANMRASYKNVELDRVNV